MNLNVAYDLVPKTRTVHASLVMDHFGLDFETGRHVVAENLDVPIRPGDIVLFTGESGSGKSSLLRALAEQLARNPIPADEPTGDDEPLTALVPDVPTDPLASPPGPPHSPAVLDANALDLGDALLVDALGLPFHDALPLLAACGLGEAQLLLRTPRELSDGQRFRFRLALAVSRAPLWIVMDEFTATLDRTTAQVVAFNVARLARRTGIGFLLATTHRDVLADLDPTLLVDCRLDGGVSVERRTGLEKKVPASPPRSASPAVPSPTGRTSPAGTTAAITWDSSDTSASCGTAKPRSGSASSPRRPSRSGSATGSSGSRDAGRARRSAR